MGTEICPYCSPVLLLYQHPESSLDVWRLAQLIERSNRLQRHIEDPPAVSIMLVLKMQTMLVMPLMLVEVSGIEPLTSCMPCKRSPS